MKKLLLSIAVVAFLAALTGCQPVRQGVENQNLQPLKLDIRAVSAKF